MKSDKNHIVAIACLIGIGTCGVSTARGCHQWNREMSSRAILAEHIRTDLPVECIGSGKTKAAISSALGQKKADSFALKLSELIKNDPGFPNSANQFYKADYSHLPMAVPYSHWRGPLTNEINQYSTAGTIADLLYDVEKENATDFQRFEYKYISTTSFMGGIDSRAQSVVYWPEIQKGINAIIKSCKQ